MVNHTFRHEETEKGDKAMRSALMVTYGVACYAVFFITFLYAVGFVGDVGVPQSVDSAPADALPGALTADVVLLGLFALQHSGMARQGFKRWITHWLPRALERSTYVLMSSLVLILLFWQWRALPQVVWQVSAPWAAWLLYALFAGGWLMVLTGTFAINHFDLFGLRQVWLRARGRDYAPLAFTMRSYYRLVRHPLMLGFIIAFWAAPRMTLGHLLFAAAGTGYILIALQLEEQDLVAYHGDAYRDYQRRVPMLCPWPRPRARPAPQASAKTE